MRTIIVLVVLCFCFRAWSDNSTTDLKNDKVIALQNLTDVIRNATKNDDTTKVVQNGITLIESSLIPIAIEVQFYRATVIFERRCNINDAMSKRIMECLNRKYENEDEILLILLREEAITYKISDRLRAAKLYEQMVILSKKIQAIQVFQYMRNLFEQGDIYIFNNNNDDTLHALECYKQVIDIHVAEYIHDEQFNAMKEIYTKAALRIVQFTPDNALCRLRFEPFAFPEIEEQFPEKVKRIPNIPPELDEFKKNVIEYLAIIGSNIQNNNPLKLQIQAVIEYLNKNRNNMRE